MTANEWRKTEIKLKQRMTRERNAAKLETTLHKKLAKLAASKITEIELHHHRINYHSLVNQ